MMRFSAGKALNGVQCPATRLFTMIRKVKLQGNPNENPPHLLLSD
jgi:hypothetical protein